VASRKASTKARAGRKTSNRRSTAGKATSKTRSALSRVAKVASNVAEVASGVAVVATGVVRQLSAGRRPNPASTPTTRRRGVRSGDTAAGRASVQSSSETSDT
jgi:hypothetical protein